MILRLKSIGNELQYTDVKKAKEELYAGVGDIGRHRWDIEIKDSGDKTVLKQDSQLDYEIIDTLLIRAYYYQKFNKIDELPCDSPIYRQFEKYLTGVLQDALWAFDDFYIGGDTIDYTFTIINGVVYLYTACNPSSKNKAYWRIRDNVNKKLPLRLKNGKDPLVLSSRTWSKFLITEMPLKYDKTKTVALHFNEKVMRQLMIADGIELKTEILETGEVRK